MIDPMARVESITRETQAAVAGLGDEASVEGRRTLRLLALAPWMDRDGTVTIRMSDLLDVLDRIPE